VYYTRMIRYTRIFLILVMAVLCGCNLTQAAPTAMPTATTVQVAVVSSPIPTLDRGTPDATITPEDAAPESAATESGDNAEAVTPSPEAAAESASAEADASALGAIGCDFAAEEPTARHIVNAAIDYEGRTAEVKQLTRFINRGEIPLNDIVFNVEPNYWHGSFSLTGVGGGTENALTGRRLTVKLGAPLEPGCAVRVELVFALNVPDIGAGLASFKGYYGATNRQLNLGHWLPTVAVRANDTWVTRESFFAGEQTVLGVADWDVTWTLSNAEDVTVAAPGDVEELGEGKGRGVLHDARDYSISLSDSFVVLRDVSITGVPVELWTLDDTEVTTPNGQIVNGGPHALTMAIRSLELFSDKFGAFGYPRMVVVEGDFPDGMEFSAFAFVSTTWFQRYDGTPNGYLTLITVHEIAHQWWYASVGSDSAMTPWLDEALCTYSEHLFLEQFYPTLTDWWWEFRVDAYFPDGYVDSSVYEFTTLREYINATYLNGARMMHQLRVDLGEGVFFDLLKRYAGIGAGEVVGSAAFWTLLTPEQLAATARTRAQFLRRADF
jgi:hypothetical protein